jgi:hypothetical protein
VPVPDSRKSLAGDAAGPQELRRLGKNSNGYLGETIERIPNAPEALAFTRRVSPVTALVSRSAHDRLRIYFLTGIHGGEPAGPLADGQLLRENEWPAGLDLWLCRCLNPTGFRLNRRANAEGLYLNRQYLHPGHRELWLMSHG